MKLCVERVGTVPYLEAEEGGGGRLGGRGSSVSLVQDLAGSYGTVVNF